MKAKSGWYQNANGTDEYGFSALPGGYRNNNGGFDYAGSRGYWWTAADYGGSDASNRSMSYTSDRVDAHNYNNKSNGYSARCVQDVRQ